MARGAFTYRGIGMKRFRSLALTLLVACSPITPEETPTRNEPIGDSLPPMRSFSAGPVLVQSRPNAEIARDFLDLAFQMESGRSLPVMSRFEGPISVRLTGNVGPTMADDLRDLLARLQSEAGVDIFLTSAPTARITVQAIPKATLSRSVPNAACFVVPNVTSWDEFLAARRSSTLDWAELTVRDQAAIFVPSDVSPQEGRDCLHEELAQAIGPLNDLYRLPDSVFNDDNMHAVLTSFDMLVLRVYNGPDLHSGMTRTQVAGLLPDILSRLNPAGNYGQARPVQPSTRTWITQIETAMSSGNSALRRIAAARQALSIAQSEGWTGPRLGFSAFVLGRLQVQEDPMAARAALELAQRAYLADPYSEVQQAHVAVQLAAFSLSGGANERTLDEVAKATAIAGKYKNAALLSTLLMFRAEAEENLGHANDAAVARLDSQAWARYGFGSERNVRSREREVAALNPH